MVVPADALLAAADACIVDLRSPAEFAEDHLPGARNVPLFDDLERALIGTLYVRRSPEDAFAAGRNRTRAKIQALMRELTGIAGRTMHETDLEARVDEFTAVGLRSLEESLVLERTSGVPAGALVLCCWRGGLRSRSLAAFLGRIGWEDVLVVEGGYKAYRRLVRERIEGWTAPRCFVLRGLTGVGKTLVLRELERQRPRWTLDLEELAGHRSSLLGMVGLKPCNQKTFESRAAKRLAQGFPGKCVLEGESRKVGDVVLPRTLWRALDCGTNLELVAPTERRLEVLISDYLAREENRFELGRQLAIIEDRLGARSWTGRLVGLLEARREEELVRILLQHYYDPLYLHSERRRRYDATFDATEPRRAAAEIVCWIEAREA